MFIVIIIITVYSENVKPVLNCQCALFDDIIVHYSILKSQ